MKKIYLLNSPILTTFGDFRYQRVEIDFIKSFFINKKLFVLSAIGHQPTADFLSQFFGFEIPMNRIQIEMQKGEAAIVFKVKARLEEGKILTQTELENTEIEFGLLEKIK